MTENVTFPTEYYSNRAVVWVSVEWLMRNATSSVDYEDWEWDLETMVREKSADTGMGHLVESIMEKGFMEAGSIGFNDGCITEGHHRFSAAILLCLDRVPISLYGGDIRCENSWATLVCAHYKDDDPQPIYL